MLRPPERATVVVIRVDFRVRGSRSLKEKRSVIQSFLRRVRDQLSIAACESGFHDDKVLASLTLATVGVRRDSCRAALHQAVEMLEDRHGAEVFAVDEEVL